MPRIPAKSFLLLTFTAVTTVFFGLSLRILLTMDPFAISSDMLGDLILLLMSIALVMISHALSLSLVTSRTWVFMTFLAESVILTITLLPSIAALPSGPLLFLSLAVLQVGIARNLPLLRVFSVRLALTGPLRSCGLGLTILVSVVTGIGTMERLQTTPFTIPQEAVQKMLAQGSEFLADRLDPSYRPIITTVFENPAVQEETLANLNRMIEPYLPFFPVAVGFLVYFTLQSLLIFVDAFVLATLHGLFRILPAIGFVKAVQTNEPVVRYVLEEEVVSPS